MIKVPSRTYWNTLRHTIARFTLRKKIRKCLFFTKFFTQNKIWCFSWCNGAMITFSSLIILGISEIRVVSFVAVLCMFKESSAEAYSASLEFSLLFVHFFSIRNTIFSNTLSLFLIFINIRKIQHVLTWKTLCDRNIFIKIIM